jgi:hypothetical protein
VQRFDIPRRFRGPPGSVNGGYACGVVAAPLGDGPVEATLLRPPPLDRELSIEVVDGESRLLDGEHVVARARRCPEFEFEVPPPVDVATAVAAAERFDVDAYRSSHLFPDCFVCGPDRAEGDGLRIFAAPAGPPEMRVWPWVPPAELFGEGVLDRRLVWAVLDCPGGLAVMLADEDAAPAVLGRLTAVVHRQPALGERLVVAGWRGGRAGRKVSAGSAIWSASGELLAAGSAVWIELTADQQLAFGGVR